MAWKSIVGLLWVVVPLTANSAPLDQSTCELLKQRIQNYSDMIDELVFLPFEDLPEGEIRKWHQMNVLHRTIAGELEKIRDAREKLESICR